MEIQLADLRWHSKIAGPWISTTIFTQGCHRECPECFNKQTWDKDGGFTLNTKKLANQLNKFAPYRRLSISGGEPILQKESLSDVISNLKKKWTILCYTGYTWENLISKKDMVSFLKSIDILVDGEYKPELSLPIDEFNFIGSYNQRIIDTKKSLKNNKIIIWKEGLLSKTIRKLRNERVDLGGMYVGRF